jgi:lipopolysaccharide export system permease protein
VREVQGRHLIDTVVKQRNEQGQYTVIARAREAEIHYDPESRTVKVEMPNCVVVGENNRGGGGVIGHQTYDVPLRDDILSSEYPNRASDMTWPELTARRQEILTEIAQLHHDADDPPSNEEILPDDHKVDLKKYRLNTIRSRERDIRSIDAEKQQRPAIAFGCLCFVLIGAPVGIWFGKSDYLSAFVTCFLPTIFVYYPLMLCGTNLVKDGTMPAVIGIWAPNVITAGLAILLRCVLLRR